MFNYSVEGKYYFPNGDGDIPSRWELMNGCFPGEISLTCQICGEVYSHSVDRRKRRFFACSDACRYECQKWAHYAKNKAEKVGRYCVVCGKALGKGRPNRKTCGNAHRVWLARHKLEFFCNVTGQEFSWLYSNADRLIHRPLPTEPTEPD